jgi:hypothetical protein
MRAIKGRFHVLKENEPFVRACRRVAAGAAAVLALTLVACDSEPAPPFEIPDTGSVEGVVFLDVTRDGGLDPAGGDRALTGVRVSLVERGTRRVLAGGQATTDEFGRFSIQGVPVGTHELLIDTVGIGPGVFVCQNPIPVTIYRNEPRFMGIAARGGCVVVIRDAVAQAVGSFITVRGVGTASQGQIHAVRTYVEDLTGGLKLISLQTGGETVSVGDTIEVSGTLALPGNATEFEVTNVRLNEIVRGGPPPVPAPTTTAAIAAAGPQPTAALQGRLVKVTGVRFTVGFGQSGLNARNAAIDDGSGPTELRIETGVFTAPGSTAEFIAALQARWPLGRCYDITGIVGSFNTVGQLFPRTQDDIEEVPCN